jgi:hypothetical protein
MTREVVTAEELLARAESNGYKKGQDLALARYVL